jgi:hypothetical protein
MERQREVEAVHQAKARLRPNLLQYPDVEEVDQSNLTKKRLQLH